MDLQHLKSFEKGDWLYCGFLFPTVDAKEEIRWTADMVLDASRDIKGVVTKYRFVEFTLDYLGIDMGAVRALEDEHGGVRWESIR